MISWLEENYVAMKSGAALVGIVLGLLSLIPLITYAWSWFQTDLVVATSRVEFSPGRKTEAVWAGLRELQQAVAAAGEPGGDDNQPAMADLPYDQRRVYSAARTLAEAAGSVPTSPPAVRWTIRITNRSDRSIGGCRIVQPNVRFIWERTVSGAFLTDAEREKLLSEVALADGGRVVISSIPSIPPGEVLEISMTGLMYESDTDFHVEGASVDQHAMIVVPDSWWQALRKSKNRAAIVLWATLALLGFMIYWLVQSLIPGNQASNSAETKNGPSAAPPPEEGTNQGD